MEDNTIIAEEKKTTKCLNCGTEFEGNFCPECGQRADTKRFTIRFIFTNLLQAILSNDGGVWFTLKTLFTRPGQMMIDILNGKRKSYFSPFPMLFLVLSLYVLIFTFTGSRDTDMNAIDKAIQAEAATAVEIKGDNVDGGTLFRNQLVGGLALCGKLYQNHYTLMMLLTIPVYIAMARLCYGRTNRRRYNWGEYCIPVVYATIIVFLYRCLASILFVFSEKIYDSMDSLGWLVTIIAYSICFKKMLEFSVVKTAWRSALVYVFYFATMFVLVVIALVAVIAYYMQKYSIEL